jgi:hypothetical protein
MPKIIRKTSWPTAATGNSPISLTGLTFLKYGVNGQSFIQE